MFGLVLVWVLLYHDLPSSSSQNPQSILIGKLCWVGQNFLTPMSEEDVNGYKKHLTEVISTK